VYFSKLLLFPDCSGKVYGNKCYFLLDEGSQNDMLTYDKALNACRVHQGKMAIIPNKDIYDFIYDFVETNARDFTRKARSLVIAWTGASYRVSLLFLNVQPYLILKVGLLGYDWYKF